MSVARLNYLQRELLHRFQTHPPSTWGTDLLSAVMAVIDLKFPVQPVGPRLRLVKGDQL